MNVFREISPYEIENAMKLIGKDWMLITAKDGEKVNTMTASWGCMGILWGKEVCVTFVRPQRYTFEFTERSDFMSLSFFDDKYRDALRFCGSHSGRDTDKFGQTGLDCAFDGEIPYIEQARLVILCKKLYADDLKKENFVVPEPLANYKNNDFHRFYVCEIKKVLARDAD